MFKKVVTKEENAHFDTIWKAICEEHGAKFYAYHEPCERFLILEEGKAIGTIEFVPRDPKNFSIVEDQFAFEGHPELSLDQSVVYEVGKLGFLKEHRNHHHFTSILAVIYHFIIVHGSKQFIAVMNKKLFRLFRLMYHIHFLRVSEDMKYGNNVNVPIIGDCSHMKCALEHHDCFEELMSIIDQSMTLLHN